MIRSLRMRLFLGTTLVSALFLSILCITLLAVLQYTLQAEFDRVLNEKARTLASLVEESEGEIRFDYRRSMFPEFEAGDTQNYFELLLDGQSYARSLSLENAHLDVTRLVPPTPPTPITLPSGKPGRIVTLKFIPRVEGSRNRGTPSHTAVLALAQGTDILTTQILRMRVLVISLCAAATLGSGIALLLVVGRAMKPVNQLAGQIEQVRIAPGTRGSAPLVSAHVPAELSPVVDRLNEMLGRLSEAFTRERAFAADAAHELRTPVSGLMTTLEVCRSRQRGVPEYETAIDRCLAILKRMQGMIEKLLLLSRAEAGQVTVSLSSVDLHSLVLDCWQDHETAAHARGMTLSLNASDTPPAHADAELLRIMISNLLENALSYADPESSIHMDAAKTPEGMQLTISNHGHALSPDDLPRLNERFWRKDKARTATGVHAGLGLSLVQRLAALQGIKMALRLEGERFVVEIDLPAG